MSIEKRIKSDAGRVVENVNTKLGAKMYEVVIDPARSFVTANSGPETVEYVVTSGDAPKVLAFIEGVESGINSAKFMSMLEETEVMEFPYYWNDPEDMTSGPCRIAIWPEVEGLRPDGDADDIEDYDSDSIFYIKMENGGDAEVYGGELEDLSEVDDEELERTHCRRCGCLHDDEGTCRQGCDETVNFDDAHEALHLIVFKLGINMPSNSEDIATFMMEDVAVTADQTLWHSGDFDIAFRRYLEGYDKDSINTAYPYYFANPDGISAGPCTIVGWPDKSFLKDFEDEGVFSGYKDEAIFEIEDTNGKTHDASRLDLKEIGKRK